jgi:ABC-type multidrug transport system permease subunit
MRQMTNKLFKILDLASFMTYSIHFLASLLVFINSEKFLASNLMIKFPFVLFVYTVRVIAVHSDELVDYLKIQIFLIDEHIRAFLTP